MTTIRSVFVKTQGIRVHALVAGEAGPPVLLVHGWPANAQLWRHALTALAPHCRAIAIDLPGFGASDKPLDLDYDAALYGGCIDGVLDALGVDGPLGLCVHDMGGPVALRWAADHVERIDRLCLLNTLVFADLSWAASAFIKTMHTPGLRAAATTHAAIRLAMRVNVSNPSRLPPQVMALYTDPYPDPLARSALWRSVIHINPADLRRVEDSLVHYKKIPVRLIYGSRDRALPEVATTMRRAHARLPHASLTRLDGIGHFLQEDAPERLNPMLVDFFTGGDAAVLV